MKAAIVASTLALIVFSPIVATADAAASPHRAGADSDWAREERNVELSHGEDGFFYQSHRASSLGEDLIEGEFILDDATFTYRFVSTEPDNETTLTADVQFARLVEYRDMNFDGRYGLGDRPVQTIRMADVEGETMNVRGGVTSDVYRIDVVYPLNDSGIPVGGSDALDARTLTIEFVVAPTTHVEGGQAIQPTQSWFDVRVKNFDYQENDTSLAMVTAFTANKALDPDTSQVSGAEGFHDVVYQWQASSSSGLLRDVHLVQDTATGGASAQTADVIFSYARASETGHSASVEAVRYNAQMIPDLLEPLLTGDWRFYSVGILISLAAVAGPAYAKTRRSSR